MTEQQRIVALCRMSVASNELGNDRQETAILEMAQRRGLVVVGRAERDVMSATKFRLNDRPGYLRAMAIVSAGLADGIAVYHIDRLTRDNRDLEDVIDTGVPVFTASGEVDLSHDSGRTIARILVAVAKGEVERKSARQKLANRQRFEAGLPHAGGPRAFGYSANGMQIVDAEAEAFRGAVAQALAGASVHSIGRTLSAAGFVSTRAQYATAGHGWTPKGVRDMLTSPRYAGLRVFQGTETTGTWPRLIDVETHLALRRQLLDPVKRNQGGHDRRKPQNLASLVAVCDVCDNTLIAGRGGANPTYTCRSRKGCISPPRAALDSAITDYILALLAQPAFAESLTPHDDERVAAATKQIDRLNRRLSVVNDDFNEGGYDDNEEEYRRILRDLRDKIKAAKQVIEDLAERQLFLGLALGEEAVVDQWPDVALDRQRIIVNRLLEVRVKPTGPRRPWNAEQHLTVRRRRHLAVG